MRSIRAFGNYPDEFMHHGSKAAQAFDMFGQALRGLINWNDYGNRGKVHQ
jgi:hypothetical protein